MARKYILGKKKFHLCSLKELAKSRGISFPVSVRGLANDMAYITPMADRLVVQ
jgi:hypothetical protein